METAIDLYTKNLLLWCVDFDMIIEELYQLFLLDLPQCSNLCFFSIKFQSSIGNLSPEKC
uniref:Uncharacterized protein n=1 Tax=Arundo donax TaxID=35708 RepID=A0A0A9H8A0_ARUDO